MTKPDVEPWVAVVANPYSGSGKNKKIVERLTAALAKHGLASRVLWDLLERREVLTDAAALAGCRCVVVAGGDGTVADVFNEMLGDEGDRRTEVRRPRGENAGILPGAVLPIGNENLFAKQFGFHGPERIAAAVARGRTMAIDLGVAGDRLFTLMVSAGLDAEVVHRVQEWRMRGGAMRRARRWSYFRPTLRALAGYRYPQVELVADGYRVSGSHALVFNLPQYACGLKFTPGCEANDGLLHWVVLPKRGALAVGRYLAMVAMGSRHLKLEGVEWGTAKVVELKAGEGVEASGNGVGTRDRRTEVRRPQVQGPQVPGAEVPVQIDGDPAGFTPMMIRVRAHAARIVVMDP